MKKNLTVLSNYKILSINRYDGCSGTNKEADSYERGAAETTLSHHLIKNKMDFMVVEGCYRN